jgi:hypothetical protein
MLNVNNPGPVSFYMGFIIEIAGFDPIPIDIAYDFFGVFDFNWVNLTPDVPSFANIGVEDRNFIMGLGSGIIFIVMFWLSVIIIFGCKRCKDMRGINKVYNFFYIDGFVRSIWIIFLLEAYIDLYLMCLVNLENGYLFLDANNWGWNGKISMSDQLSILLGMFFMIQVAIFPFFLMYLFTIKSGPYEHRMTHDKENAFNEKYADLYDGFKKNCHPTLYYNMVFIIRRLIFVSMVYFLSDPSWATAQVFLNILLSLFFVGYLLVMKPFVD